MEEVTQYYDFEEALQGQSMGWGTVMAIYNSDVADKAQKEKNQLLADYFRLVDAAVVGRLDNLAAPLLLASVAYYQPIYRAINSCRHLNEDGLTSNFDHTPPAELHRQATILLSDTLVQTRQQRIEEYQNGSGSNWVAPDNRQVLKAAAAGRVKAFFVQAEAEVWGHFDEATLTVTVHDAPHASDESLMDQAALLTLRNGGEVHILDEAKLLARAAPVNHRFRPGWPRLGQSPLLTQRFILHGQ